MKWWKPKRHSVCSACGVHFEPVAKHEARWGHLCSEHRKPVKERDLKRDAVVYWAFKNFERLAKIMEEEEGEYIKKYNSMAGLGQCSPSCHDTQQQQSAYSGPPGLTASPDGRFFWYK